MIATLLVLAVAVQDDPWETHLYNVEFLTREVPDRPGFALGLSMDAIGVMVAGGDLGKGRLDGEDLTGLIRNNVAEDSWEHVQAKIDYAQGILTVTNKRSVHEKIRQYLTYWRSFFGKMVVVDALVLSVDPQFFAKVRAAGVADRPLALPPEHLKALLDAAREGKVATLHKSMRITAHPGQRVHLADAQRRTFVRDHDVQIATAALALDPIIDVFSVGLTIDVRPFIEPFGNAVTLETRINRAEPEAVVERKLRIVRELTFASAFDVPTADGTKQAAQPVRGAGLPAAEVKIELPRIALDTVRTTLTVKNRETAIVGSTHRDGRRLLFLMTPAVVALDEKPAPEPAFEEQRLLKMYDVSPLTRRIQDWTGPRIGLMSPSSGGGGPLTGASFALDEPAALMESESVIELIRTRVSPDTWGNKRNSLTVGPNGALLVRQRAEVLREVDRFLGQLLSARAQMISVEGVVIAFRKNARLDLEREVPALAAGGYFAEQATFERLLEEAYKGQNVRILETAETACFPQEQVFVARLLQESHLQDWEPQVSTCASAFDPIVGTAIGGFVFEVRPHFVHGTDEIAVSLRAQLAGHRMTEIDATPASGSPLQMPIGGHSAWEADVLCAKGKWSLVGLQTRWAGEESEEVVLFVRARPNLLK